MKRDSIFTILFSIFFLTFLEFKLEKISRLPPKRLQVSVWVEFSTSRFLFIELEWFWPKEFIRILFCGLILGFRFKRRIGLRNSSWIQARQGNSCWLVSKQGKYTQSYWFQLLSDLLELEEFSYRKFDSEFSELLGTIRSAARLTDTWPRADRHRSASRNCEFG